MGLRGGSGGIWETGKSKMARVEKEGNDSGSTLNQSAVTSRPSGGSVYVSDQANGVVRSRRCGKYGGVENAAGFTPSGKSSYRG